MGILIGSRLVYGGYKLLTEYGGVLGAIGIFLILIGCIFVFRGLQMIKEGDLGPE
jgi:hypothetical protein